MFVLSSIRRLYGASCSSDGCQVAAAVSLILTGQLGDVMKESARAGLTYATNNASRFNIPKDRLGAIEVHIHVPAGAIPKDGPSAGVAIVTSLVSEMSGRPVRRDVAMTGEITLRGRVLPIGGLKEKLLAALRGGITTVLIPSENEKDLAEIPASVKELLEIVPVAHVDEVLARALAEPVVAIEWTDADDHATEPVTHPHASSESPAIRH